MAKYNLIVIIASCLDVCCVLTVRNILHKSEDVCFEILRKVGDTTSRHDETSQKTWSADSFVSCWFQLTSFNVVFYTAELHAKGSGSGRLCNFKYHPGICLEGLRKATITSVQRVLWPGYERWTSRTHIKNVNTRPRSSVYVYSVKLEGNVQLKAEPARRLCINSLHYATLPHV